MKASLLRRIEALERFVANRGRYAFGRTILKWPSREEFDKTREHDEWRFFKKKDSSGRHICWEMRHPDGDPYPEAYDDPDISSHEWWSTEHPGEPLPEWWDECERQHDDDDAAGLTMQERIRRDLRVRRENRIKNTTEWRQQWLAFQTAPRRR